MGTAVAPPWPEETLVRRRRPRGRLNRQFKDLVALYFARMPTVVLNDSLSQRAVHNLASRPLSATEQQALNLGLKFIPTPRVSTDSELNTAVQDYCRRVRIACAFPREQQSQCRPRLFLRNTTYQPPAANREVEQYLRAVQDHFIATKSTLLQPAHSNLSKSLATAIRKLATDKSIVIKAADKNLGVTVLSSSWYTQEALRQLSDAAVYQPVTAIPLAKLGECLRAWGRRWKILFPAKTVEFIQNGRSSANDSRVCRFYLLPKLHKTPVVGRPICSSVGWVLENASRFLDDALRPLLRFSTTHLTDSQSLLLNLIDLPIPSSTVFMTYDVQNLYPSIPTALGLKAVEHFAQRQFVPAKTTALLQLLQLVMT